MGSLLIVLLGSVTLGFFLIFILALSEKKKRGGDLADAEKNWMTRDRFEKACVMVLEEMKLDIGEISRSGDSRLDLIVRNPTPITGGEFLVHCLYLSPDETIDQAEIIEFSNMVLQERLSKGILITTGRFTKEIPAIGELAPIEFVDGEAFQKLMTKYNVYPVIRS